MDTSLARYAPVLGVGILVGILLFGLARFAFAPADAAVHYHANFAIFVDGERLDLSADRYMQDVAACHADPSHVAPEERVHLHNNDPDVVHVHHSGATWGHFLMNLGFGLGDDYLITDEGARYESTPERGLKFVVNGFDVSSVYNRVIAPGDRLLISYGPESAAEVTEIQFPQVASNAPEFDTMPDPAGCAGPDELGTGERLRRAFWF
jgi:hypothetical protein